MTEQFLLFVLLDCSLRKARSATAGHQHKERTRTRGAGGQGGATHCAPVDGQLTEQQELALISVEPQQLAAEVLDVGVQAVLPQQDGKVLQL